MNTKTFEIEELNETENQFPLTDEEAEDLRAKSKEERRKWLNRKLRGRRAR